MQKRASELDRDDLMYRHGRWQTVGDIIEVHPPLSGGRSIEVKAAHTGKIIGHLKPDDIVEIQEPT